MALKLKIVKQGFPQYSINHIMIENTDKNLFTSQLFVGTWVGLFSALIPIWKYNLNVVESLRLIEENRSILKLINWQSSTSLLLCLVSVAKSANFIPYFSIPASIKLSRETLVIIISLLDHYNTRKLGSHLLLTPLRSMTIGYWIGFAISNGLNRLVVI